MFSKLNMKHKYILEIEVGSNCDNSDILHGALCHVLNKDADEISVELVHEETETNQKQT